MEIKGQITDIIYENEINGYMVAEFQTKEEDTVITGYLPFINNGDSLKLIGKYFNHQEYGRQFKVETFEKIMPETLDALERYLAGGIISGVGPATARKIIDKFGEETIHILRFEPDKLAQVKGINKEKAIRISEEFAEKWDLWEIVGFLEKFGISEYDANIIVKEKDYADYFEECVNLGMNAKSAANWLIVQIIAYLNKLDMKLKDFFITPNLLNQIISELDKGTISSKQAKEIFNKSLEENKEPKTFITKDNAQISDKDALEEIIDNILANNEQQIIDYKMVELIYLIILLVKR